MGIALKKTDERQKVNIIELWRYLSDYRGYFDGLVKDCISCIRSGECYDDLWAEIIIVFRNEYMGSGDADVEQKIFEIYKSALSVGHNLKAYEAMDLIRIPSLKFSAYMLYAGRLKKYCGEEYAEVYYNKARKIVNDDEAVKSHLIKTKNITNYLGGHNEQKG
ncbi:MAG: hypothetical protein ACOCWO_05175 [Candidatus Muiribacteriaceae bacterium]